MNTRDIADKLWAYADLLDSEAHRAHAIWRITHEDSASELKVRLDVEIEEVRSMANKLWDKKESI
ncbi:hypothetical protein [Burkholderia cenocepacia]|uniref:hypothetical protein n=1 Tax=Burkholderia cenocepacia TaxID=95486 RepID=UPI002B24F113|nr:hypothetical protein [Burkholderia cenocepacia]MEB2554099.1 hypothetical protein [Burkholderia cenocepacia]